MGITGLLPYLKKIHSPVNISQFEGCTVAVDAYCWLHKGAFSCAEKLALGEHTDQYVYYCMRYVDCLLKKKVQPILVFDGCHLPSKRDVEKSRRERRETYRKKAAAFLRDGRRSEAKECLQRCVDITSEMALKLINACRSKGVDCIVAPYEADAQLAYLNRTGIAQVIITEDSDLLPFGCDRIVYKMDMFGNGTLVEKSRVNEVLQIRSDLFTFDKFRYVCILSGCDYLPSLPGIGLVKANKVFKMARQTDLKVLLSKLPSYLKMKVAVTDEYVDGFLQADNTFLHQLVFNPHKRCVVPLHPYQADADPRQMQYAGPYIPNSRALQIALGNLDISSGEKIGHFDPESNRRSNSAGHQLSIWDGNYKVQSKITLKENFGDKANLAEKDIDENTVVRRKSSVKRKREASENEDTKSDMELVSIYDDNEPDEKKQQRETQNESSYPENTDFGPVVSSCKSPQKHRGQAVTAADVWPVTAISPPTAQERNKHNKFALSHSSCRARFNLNVSRSEVRSRYFAGKDQSDAKLRLEIENSCTKDITSESLNKVVQNSQEETTCGQSDQTIIKMSHQNTSSSSLFSWSRLSVCASVKRVLDGNTGVQAESSRRGVCSERVLVTDSPTCRQDDHTGTDQQSQSHHFSSPTSSSKIPSVFKFAAQSRTSCKPSEASSKQCRVSGLARSNKRTNPLGKDKQKNIKEMFSQFSFKKGVQQ